LISSFIGFLPFGIQTQFMPFCARLQR
jgi:hypothetical protein